MKFIIAGLNSLARSDYISRHYSFKGERERHFLFSKLLLAISPLPSWMRPGSPSLHSPPLPFPPYWIANNDFPHVAASPDIQCQELQWLPALYFERFSARLTRRPPRRREISADTRDAFALKCRYASGKKYWTHLRGTLAILVDGARSSWLKRPHV